MILPLQAFLRAVNFLYILGPCGCNLLLDSSIKLFQLDGLQFPFEEGSFPS
jgi:hypothetical protein